MNPLLFFVLVTALFPLGIGTRPALSTFLYAGIHGDAFLTSGSSYTDWRTGSSYNFV